MIGGSSNATCKRCKNKVVSGVKCSECESLFHNSCAKLSTNVKIIDENTIKCCDQSEAVQQELNDEAFYEALNEICGVDNNKIDIRLVKYLLKQKDDVIHHLEERVKTLVQHIETITNQHEMRRGSNKGNQIMNSSGNNSNHHSFKRPDFTITDSDVQISAEKVTPAVKYSEVVKESCRSVNHNSGDSVQNGECSSQNNEWYTVTHKSKGKVPRPELFLNTKRKTVVGMNRQQEGSNLPQLQGVPKTISLHVYRLSPATKVEHVINFLKNKFPEVRVEQLTSRHPDMYSSFKVDIYEEHFEAALDPNLWPLNACVRRFLHFHPRVIEDK